MAPKTSSKESAPKPEVKQPTEEIDGAQNLSGINSEDSVLLTIRVVSAKNIRGAKGEHVNSFVRVQFADFDFKDTPVAVDTSSPEYNFQVEQNLHVDEGLIDTVANKKVTFTLIESLPKEKTQVLGTADICLGSVFLKYPQRDTTAPADVPLSPPPLSFKDSVSITYLNSRLLPGASKDGEPSNLPELFFEASLSKPLIPPEVVENGNFITFKLDDLFPVPDEWTLKEGTEKDLNSNIYTYNLNLLVPAETSLERMVSIGGGSLTTSEVPILTESPTFGAVPIYLAKPPDASGAANGADGTLAEPGSKLDGTAPQTPGAASDKAPTNVEAPTQTFKKVAWNNAYTVWFPPESVVRLREKIMSKQLIEIEFAREFQPRFSHLVDSNSGKYRGKACIDAACLLYPRVIGLKGRFTLDVFDPPGSPGDGTIGNTDQTAGANAKGKPGRGAKEETLGTNVGLEIMLEKPLLDKKKLQPITKSVADFIPKRFIPDDMVFEKRSLKADEDYRIQIQEIVRCLVNEYDDALTNNLFAIPENSVSEEPPIQSKNSHEEQINGSYFSFKERLKTAVVDIVREMFKEREASFADPTVSKTADFSLLKKFADEAEEDHNISISTAYHQERIAKYEDSFQAWFEYGTFCMRNALASKGIECFKEVLSRNPKHIPSLLAYGAICSGLEKYEEARVFLVTAVELQPTYVLSSTLLGLFYDIIGEEVESEKYLTEAAKMSKNDSADNGSNFMAAARFLVNCHAPQLAERALSQEILVSGQPSNGVQAYLLLARLEVQRGNFSSAIQHIREALDVRQDDPDAWTFLAHVHFIQKQWSDAQTSYETVLSLPEESKDLAKVYIRLGTVYLITVKSLIQVNLDQHHLSHAVRVQKLKAELSQVEINAAKLAKTMFLRACELVPSSKSWLGVGKACIALGEFTEAEDALSEANVLNNRDDRTFEANQAISQALRVGVKDPEILRMTGAAFYILNFAASASECLRVALELQPDDLSTQEIFVKALAQGSRDFLSNSGDGGKNGESYGPEVTALEGERNHEQVIV
ncbi:Cilia- and flagella-associated protein 70 [Phlyctochytrium planicorne]|nr:Cilia- and flagella-associated protein 70 [Phlyctochytrium planicorne]